MRKTERLFKYFRISDYSLANLKDCTLWFSSFNDFNDAFEGRFRIEKKYPNLFKTYEAAEDFYFKLFSFLVDGGLSRGNIEILDSHGDDLKAKLELLFRFVGTAISDALRNLVRADGYCCFSKGADKTLCNSLMWAHYADGLRGFCLAFDRRRLSESLDHVGAPSDVMFNPIRYTDQIPCFDVFEHLDHYLKSEEDHPATDFYFDVRSTKARAWRYESEWRAISSQQGLHRYSPQCLTEVFLGERMSAADRGRLEEILLEVHPGVKRSEVRMATDSYVLGSHPTT